MNRLVIIGNGFDLAHDMKTSYKSFIEWYFKQCYSQVFLKDPFSYKDELLEISFHYSNHLLSRHDRPDRLSVYVEYENSGDPIVLLRKLQKMSGFVVSIQPFLGRIINDVEKKGWAEIDMNPES